MIISDKSELVKLVRQDWLSMNDSARRDSFIYGYKKKEMDARVMQLIGEAGLTTLRAIMDYDKDNKDNIDHKSIIRTYGIYSLVRAAREVYISHDRSEEYSEMYAKIFWKMYAKARNLKKGIRNTDPPSEEEADSFEASLLKGLVTDYFRNNGYKTQKVRTMDDDAFTEKDQKGNTAAKITKDEYDVVEVMPEDRKDSFYIDDIKMLNAFMQYLEGKGEEKSFQDTEKSKEQYIPAALDDASFARFSALYSELVEKKQDNVFLPLLFDSTCGAGLYIIGAEHFKGVDGDTSRSGKPCYACNIYYDSILEHVYKLKDPLNSDKENEYLDLLMGIDRYDNMKDAVDGFKNGKARWIESINASIDAEEKIIAAYKQGRESDNEEEEEIRKEKEKASQKQK